MNRTTTEIVRLSFDTGQSYAGFRRRFEGAVPDISSEYLAAYAARGARWDEVVADAMNSSPHGFFIYWRSDLAPLMSLAGSTVLCSTYLMGNHTIAPRMYRREPEAMLYMPLHTLIHADDQGTAWFVLDRPSSVFSSFGKPEITQVGTELDSKVLALLAALDVAIEP